MYSGGYFIFKSTLNIIGICNICNKTCYGGCWPVHTPGPKASVPEGVLPAGLLKGGGVSGSPAVTLNERRSQWADPRASSYGEPQTFMLVQPWWPTGVTLSLTPLTVLAPLCLACPLSPSWITLDVNNLNLNHFLGVCFWGNPN